MSSRGTKGEPVLHIYVLFIICCFVYAGKCVYDYIEYLEDTIELQDESIKKQREENDVLKRYINQMYMLQAPTYKAPTYIQPI